MSGQLDDKDVESIENSVKDDIEDDSNTTYTGYIKIKTLKDDYKTNYAKIMSGTMFTYKSYSDHEVKHEIILSGSNSVVKEVKGVQTIFITTSKDQTCQLQFSSSTDLNIFQAAYSSAKNMEPFSLSKLTDDTKLKSSIKFRTKNKITKEFATSSLGKALIKKFVNKQSKALIKTFNKVSTKLNGKKQAEQDENDMIKILINIFLLVEEKKVSKSQFDSIDVILKDLSEVYTKIFAFKDKLDPSVIREKLNSVTVHYDKIIHTLVDILSKHTSAKEIFRLQSVLYKLSNIETIFKLIYDEELEEEADIIFSSIERYSQFVN